MAAVEPQFYTRLCHVLGRPYLASRQFVDDPQRQALFECFAGIIYGRGSLFLLVGEPGIGKTRTAEELANQAHLENAQVLVGRCHEGEGAPAYWPWIQVIRTYLHGCDPKLLLSDMGPGAADIAQVVPEVREHLPELPTPPALQPEQARALLCQCRVVSCGAGAPHWPLRGE